VCVCGQRLFYQALAQLRNEIDLSGVTRILDEFGVRTDSLSSLLLNSYETTVLDPDGNSVVIGSEMNPEVNPALMQLQEGGGGDSILHKVASEFFRLRINELQRLDANLDGEIRLGEFSAWVGKDPDVMFDLYDLDKSGYLDEEEMTRFLIDKQVPRFAVAMINLDPDFDGRIYFSKYKAWLSRAPAFMFNKYDLDATGDLDEGELADLTVDLGVNLDHLALKELVDKKTSTVSFERYSEWFRREPGQIRTFRDGLKADNRPHQTKPDRLTGPLHTVEARRAKYVAISSLTSDFLDTSELLKEVEGEFDNAQELIAIMTADGLLFNDGNLHPHPHPHPPHPPHPSPSPSNHSKSVGLTTLARRPVLFLSGTAFPPTRSNTKLHIGTVGTKKADPQRHPAFNMPQSARTLRVTQRAARSAYTIHHMSQRNRNSTGATLQASSTVRTTK
jgi:Ca2+-binding EF-hand superfamily protein